MGWGGRLFEAGRLLTFSAFGMGAYSRWALIRGWALNRINTVVVVIGSSHRRRAKSPLGTVLIINLLGKGLTPRACMGDGGSI